MQEVLPNEIMDKARKVIENQKDAQYLNETEYEWLKVNGGVIYTTYNMALKTRRKLANKELGGIDDAR